MEDTENKMFNLKAKCWRSLLKRENPNDVTVQINTVLVYRRVSFSLSLLHTRMRAYAHTRTRFIIGHQSGQKEYQQKCPVQAAHRSGTNLEEITPKPLMKLTFAKATTDRQQRKRDPVLYRLYEPRNQEALDNMGKALKSRSRNILFSYILDDRDYSMKESLFGDIPNGSPLKNQLQKYHTMVSNFEAYLPLPVQEQNDDSIAVFPSLPTKTGVPTIQVTEEVFSKDILSLSLDMIKCSELESLTLTQSENPLWASSRARGLTSSKFGVVINRKSVPVEGK